MRNSIFYYFGLVTQVGLTIIICILLSLWIGRYIDTWLGTKGIFSIVFILIGIAAGFVSVYKQIIAKDERKDI